MLKRLELVGFKSFADKTTFDFSDGLTAVVGPNGSGKSNIVDAIRWILGEQSAKSLRGGEMADVIFNGSSSRRSHALAEVTLTFDNRKRQLALDMEEVQVTRRVYRTGEGEYLINGQPSRLKDIKDLFLGSGAGHDAYSIIAQGQVDILLQTSTRERRAIFEEAAGISRFKAKKIETLRKLERVDQNLARVKDIIDEVEKQHRSVKLQAAKAQRWHEYSTRLKELRLTLGLDEYGQWTQQIDAATQVLDGLRTELDQRAARAAACEADAERLEIFLADLDDTLRDHEARLATTLQEIKSQESTLTHESALTADLEAELERGRRRGRDLTERLGALTRAAEQASQELANAETETARQRTLAQTLDTELQETEQRWTTLQQELAADQGEHLEQMRRAAHLQNDAIAAKAQLDSLERERERLRHRSQQASANLEHIDVELDTLVTADAHLQQSLHTARQALIQKRAAQEALQARRDQTAERLSTLRQERSRLASRVEVLHDLIQSHEGLSAGVREIFALLERPDSGPWSTVLGMIADFLTVKREYAHLIDLALGDMVHRFLVREPERLAEALAQRTAPLAGRVSFMPMAQAQQADALIDLKSNRLVQVSLLSRVKQPDAEAPTPDHPGLVAPAVQVVSCEHPELADLPELLLGRTLIVRDLATARALAAATHGYRLVTLQGELLEPDGTLTTGTHQPEAGLLSRKSEHAELQSQLTGVDADIGAAEGAFQAQREELAQLDRAIFTQQEEIGVLAEQAADLHARVERHRDRQHGLHEEVSLHRGELQRIEDDVARLEGTRHEVESAVAAAQAEVERLQARLHRADQEVRRLDQQRQERQATVTQAQVTLATMEERLRALGTQHQQLERELQQRDQERAQTAQAQTACLERLRDSQLAMLAASAALAHAYLAKEAAQREIGGLLAQRDLKRQERVRLVQLAQTVRGEWRTQQEQFHARELALNDLRHQRDTLVARLREDYQVELAEMYQSSLNRDAQQSAGPSPPAPLPKGERGENQPLDAAALNEEIAELRRKLARLGNVNMEALEELRDLESRSVALQTQFNDLTAAKSSLTEIITKINQDSRRMFVETFQAVRGHFQELFRKLFGGGMADVVLEDENDVLECGIEIVARPPGKELRSISLLSGGEKTLTAVALLLAIFRSKPSPFCVLDEVDAALDEANIGRFTAVLREFLEQSQFIIVTHSKKTMAAADVLYGITMQESGVSKQVTIRFDDWVEPEAEAPPRQEVA